MFSKSTLSTALLLGSSALALVACGNKEAKEPPVADAKTEMAKPAEATQQTAAEFVAEAEQVFADFSKKASQIHWAYQTDLSEENEAKVTEISAKGTAMAVEYANKAGAYNDADVSPVVRRKLDILKQGITLPAPNNPEAADRLAALTTELSSAYSKGKIEFDGKTVPQNETELLMRSLKNPAQLEEVWTKWRDVAKASKSTYQEMVGIVNKGAQELGYKDLGAMWRSGYDMDADAFATETDRLWSQVEPLYTELQCHVKYRLNEKYGDEAVPLDKPIRADLLGNMWAQSWGSIYEDVAPAGAGSPVDLDKALVEANYTPIKMVEVGEDFFSSLGFEPLPQTFWDRSQFVKPDDREVVCHASAWDLDDEEDIRIKMCINVDGDDFVTVHHELGHNYYQRAYKDQPYLFKNGANDGFHEAIGDMVALSITPAYLKQIGLIDEVPDASADIGLLMQQALDKVAFMPFGLLVDKWRWQVFSGELTPETYNDGWWALREQYQGIRPPADRPADAFDPGSKYHVPNNVPYTRYFLAHILQFQFFQSACQTINWEGPLHRCSFYGSKEVGGKLNTMLEAGASQPWQQTLASFTGSPEMNGSAVVDYFAPLMAYLKEENKDRQCGW